MKVLYIGGTGEISLACVEASVAAGQQVTVFNRSKSDEPLPAGVERIVGEMNDTTYQGLGARGFDVVCQFVAYEPEQVERDLAVFGGRVGQYLFVSTASAYQKPPLDWRITERTPLANPYWRYSPSASRVVRLKRRSPWRSGCAITASINRRASPLPRYASRM